MLQSSRGDPTSQAGTFIAESRGPKLLEGIDLYGVLGSRRLSASRGGKPVWSDDLGFVPNADHVPGMARGLLLFQGTMQEAPIDCFASMHPIPANCSGTWSPNPRNPLQEYRRSTHR